LLAPNRRSALAVAAGGFGPGANAGTVVGSGAVVGTVMPAATATPVNVCSAFDIIAAASAPRYSQPVSLPEGSGDY
jgi:hypothetical protein